MTEPKQQKRIKRDVSGWLILNKGLERCQQKCGAVLRFGSATKTKT